MIFTAGAGGIFFRWRGFDYGLFKATSGVKFSVFIGKFFLKVFERVKYQGSLDF